MPARCCTAPSPEIRGLPAQRVAVHQDRHRTTGAVSHRAPCRRTGNRSPRVDGYGVLLLRDAAGDAAALSFGKLHNLLNVNTVERAQARQDGTTSFREVMFPMPWETAPATGAKTAKAASCSRCTAPAAQLPDPFAPGGPLYGSPAQALNPDGSVTIKRPAMRVHDSKGARVVKR